MDRKQLIIEINIELNRISNIIPQLINQKQTETFLNKIKNAKKEIEYVKMERLEYLLSDLKSTI